MVIDPIKLPEEPISLATVDSALVPGVFLGYHGCAAQLFGFDAESHFKMISPGLLAAPEIPEAVPQTFESLAIIRDNRTGNRILLFGTRNGHLTVREWEVDQESPSPTILLDYVLGQTPVFVERDSSHADAAFASCGSCFFRVNSDHTKPKSVGIVRVWHTDGESLKDKVWMVLTCLTSIATGISS